MPGSAIFSLVILITASIAAATDHIVGGHLGWNPNVNYTVWSQNQTFYVNDLISFRYQKNQYNVFEVNKTGYDNCTMDGLAGNWSKGKDFIPLDEAKTYYFICGNGYCMSGMKVAVTVHPFPSNSTSEKATPSHNAARSNGGIMTSAEAGVGAVVAGLLIGFGSLWI